MWNLPEDRIIAMGEENPGAKRRHHVTSTRSAPTRDTAPARSLAGSELAPGVHEVSHGLARLTGGLRELQVTSIGPLEDPVDEARDERIGVDALETQRVRLRCHGLPPTRR